MSEPKWLTKRLVIAMHGEALAEHGGLYGLRDEGLLESALAKPMNAAAYGEPSLFELAAAYGFGFAKNHAFHDGNKRLALIAIDVFLQQNGWELTADETNAANFIVALASGEKPEPELAAWIKENAQQLE
jgi:death-on-curing protein